MMSCPTVYATIKNTVDDVVIIDVNQRATTVSALDKLGKLADAPAIDAVHALQPYKSTADAVT